MTGIDSIVLLGPTGSGKTPLGDMMEQRGLWGRRCVHFDFGAQLRAVAAGAIVVPALGDEDMRVVRHSLRSGALLEDEQFPIARAILRDFIDNRAPDGQSLLVLNGLPRHVGQARGIVALVRVAAVVSLRCTAETVRNRIRTNAGGDRSGRADDDLGAVAQRLAIYNSRTAPLVDFYRCAGVPVYELPVAHDTTAHDLWTALGGTAPPPDIR